MRSDQLLKLVTLIYGNEMLAFMKNQMMQRFELWDCTSSPFVKDGSVYPVVKEVI